MAVKIKVYQANLEAFMDTICYYMLSNGLEKVKSHWNHGNYNLVATVEHEAVQQELLVPVPSLELAFTLTGSWYNNPGVKLHSNPRMARSTSVGDILEVDGKHYVVASTGFQEVDFGSVPLEARKNDDHSKHF